MQIIPTESLLNTLLRHFFPLLWSSLLCPEEKYDVKIFGKNGEKTKSAFILSIAQLNT